MTGVDASLEQAWSGGIKESFSRWTDRAYCSCEPCCGGMQQDAMVERFRKARDRENEHLAKVRGWFESLALASGEQRSAKRKFTSH